MRIHNFRAGFATNSSSSHSVILLAPNKIGAFTGRGPEDRDSYGWDQFVLASGEAKLRYLAAQFMQSYWRDPAARADIIERFDEELSGFATSLDLSDDDPPITIDHQSAWKLPTPFNPAFADAFIRFFRSPQVVVLGGNDNEDNDFAIPFGTVEWGSSIPSDCSNRTFVAREDDGVWVIFDQRSGTKVRLSFDTSRLMPRAPGEYSASDDIVATDPDYTKARAPELVDLKITDWCNRGCQFCYQSSTKDGLHAPIADILRVVDMLAEMEVMEIALGGGEPTAHPDFPDIMRYIRSKGIVPNFTTFSDAWLLNSRIVEAVAETVGAIGVSCHDAKGLALVKRIAMLFNNGEIDRYDPDARVVAQHVVGAVPMDVTATFIQEAAKANLPILLLGYKDVGFGRDFRRRDEDVVDRIRAACEDRYMSLSVDTALLDQYPDLIDAVRSVRALAASPEGKFSCYVDAVTGRMGPSSYAPDRMTPLAADTAMFKAVFAGY